MLKKVILILLLLASLIESRDFNSIKLSEFIGIISNTSKFNIVVSDTVKKDMSIFLPYKNFSNRKDNFELLVNVLEVNNLSYKLVSDVLIIYDKFKIKKIESFKSDYIVKFENLSNDEIKNYFSRLYPELKYVILRGRIFLNTTFKNYKNISKQLSLLDKSFLTKKIDVTVISTNNSINKDIGTDFNLISSYPSAYISILTSRVDTPIILQSKTQFYSFLNLMSEKKYSDIISHPQITLSDQKDSLLESTTNLPYISKTTSITDNQVSTENSYSYKDVGLKIYFTNVSISKESINFDLEIYIQSILDSSLTPKISNKHIKTHCTLTNDSVFFLGGLNETTLLDDTTNIPILEYVPLINKITERNIKTKEKFTFSIILSVAEDI